MSGRVVVSHEVLSTTSAATIWLTRTRFDDWLRLPARWVIGLPRRTASTSTEASPIEPGRRNVVVTVRIGRSPTTRCAAVIAIAERYPPWIPISDDHAGSNRAPNRFGSEPTVNDVVASKTVRPLTALSDSGTSKLIAKSLP